MAYPQLDVAQLKSYGLSWSDSFLIRDGRTVILDQARVRQTVAFMQRSSFRELEINQGLGFHGSEISCLRSFAFLSGLHVLHHLLPDISPISGITELETLELQTFWKLPIDLREFPRLRRCRLLWRPGARTVFGCPSIEWLFLDYFKSKDLSPVLKLRQLRHLAISNSPLEDISPVAELPPLRELCLINLRKLSALSPLSGQTELKRLEIDGSRKLTNIEALAGMTQLEILYLCNVGQIASLKPLQRLHRLQKLFMWEDTDVQDGDMSVLLELPELRLVAFANRRHYSHTREEISKILETRHGRSLAER